LEQNPRDCTFYFPCGTGDAMEPSAWRREVYVKDDRGSGGASVVRIPGVFVDKVVVVENPNDGH
jgi:hypothetical protein